MSKDSDCSLVSNKNFGEILPSNGLGLGAGEVDQGGLEQGFSNFWCYGAHEEIDHNLRSPTINF